MGRLAILTFGAKSMSNQDQSGTQLHITFVEMLFALAIGQIAIGFSKLIDYQSMSTETFCALIPAYSHLFLSAIVISTSWVGWRTSKVSGTRIQHVFTLDYFELLIDVSLVVMYFVLARAVEIPALQTDSLVPDASFEAMTLAIIISTYAIWDIVSCRTNPTKFTKRLWASIVCTTISWVLVIFDISRSGTVLAVLLGDFSLIALILTFRAMKLHDFREHNARSWLLVLFLLLLVLIFFIASITL